MSKRGSTKRVLAVASAGGHWIQLQRLRTAFEGCDVAWVTTNRGYRDDVAEDRFHVVRDANRWDRIGMVIQLCQIALVLLRERPDVIVSTGAAPGYLALRLGRMLGARTAWVDSIANAEELSLSGRMAGQCADLWLTQWPELATPEGPEHAGAVL